MWPPLHPAGRPGDGKGGRFPRAWLAVAQYRNRIWPTVLRLFERYQVPAPYRCCYREPSWSLQRYPANVAAYGDGTCHLVDAGPTRSARMRR